MFYSLYDTIQWKSLFKLTWTEKLSMVSLI